MKYLNPLRNLSAQRFLSLENDYFKFINNLNLYTGTLHVVHYVAERGQCSMKKPKVFDMIQTPVKSERSTLSELGE